MNSEFKNNLHNSIKNEILSSKIKSESLRRFFLKLVFLLLFLSKNALTADGKYIILILEDPLFLQYLQSLYILNNIKTCLFRAGEAENQSYSDTVSLLPKVLLSSDFIAVNVRRKKTFLVAELKQDLDLYLAYDISELKEMKASDAEAFSGIFLKLLYYLYAYVSVSSKRLRISFNLADENLFNFLSSLMATSGISTSLYKRSGVKKISYTLYFQKTESISRFLALIKTRNSLFMYEDFLLRRQINQDVNRHTNCDAANMQRLALAANKQCEFLAAHVQSPQFNLLNIEQQELVFKRLQFPAYSLQDLAEALSYPLSKNKLYYELKKIQKILGKEKAGDGGDLV